MNVLLIDTHTVLNSSYIQDFKKTVEGLGPHCEVRRFDDVALSSRIDNFDAIIIGGSAALLSQVEIIKQYQSAIELVKNTSTPMLGVCFGHQLIGVAFGRRIIPLGKEIRGFEPVQILESENSSNTRDFLFNSLPDEIRVYEWHSEVIEQLPQDFKLLASSEDSAIEAMVRKQCFIYGIQFHAEIYNPENSDGKIVLQNFFTLVKK